MKKRSYFAVWSTLAIGIALLAVPVHAQFVYVANEGSDNVSAYSIAPNGILTFIPAPPGANPVAAGTGPASVAVDPTGRFVYVANNGSNNVSAYKVGPTGTLEFIDMPPGANPVAAGTGPASVAVDPTGRFVYVANHGSNNLPTSHMPSEISAYSIGPNGLLKPIAGSPFAAETWPEAVAVDPTGKFVYVANYYGNNISAYRVDPIGALVPIVGSPFAAGGGESTPYP